MSDSTISQKLEKIGDRLELLHSDLHELTAEIDRTWSVRSEQGDDRLEAVLKAAQWAVTKLKEANNLVAEAIHYDREELNAELS
jgi:hypothetical protein